MIVLITSFFVDNSYKTLVDFTNHNIKSADSEILVVNNQCFQKVSKKFKKYTLDPNQFLFRPHKPFFVYNGLKCKITGRSPFSSTIFESPKIVRNGSTEFRQKSLKYLRRKKNHSNFMANKMDRMRLDRLVEISNKNIPKSVSKVRVQTLYCPKSGSDATVQYIICVLPIIDNVFSSHFM